MDDKILEKAEPTFIVVVGLRRGKDTNTVKSAEKEYGAPHDFMLPCLPCSSPQTMIFLHKPPIVAATVAKLLSHYKGR